MEGLLIINKPSGWTSHDVVSRVRRQWNIKRVGHAGTLDPAATGVLVLLIGKATKLSDKFIGMDKAYRSTLVLGTITDTADTQGAILTQNPYHDVTEGQVKELFKAFTGDQQQVPPMYSAVKVKGRKLYELARKGIEIKRAPRDISIYQLRLESFHLPEVKFYMECSKGTYVRQLAADIGERLGCGACVGQIERTKVGPFTIDMAVPLDQINEHHLRHWNI